MKTIACCPVMLLILTAFIGTLPAHGDELYFPPAEGEWEAVEPATQHTFKTARIGRVQPDGQFEIVWTAARPEAPMPYPASRTNEEWRALLHELYTGWGDNWSAPATE